jgi:hypothetical protein
MATFETSATGSLSGTDDVTFLATGSFTPAGTNRAVLGISGTYQSAVTHNDFDSGSTQLTQIGSTQSTNAGAISVWSAAAPDASSQTAVGAWSAIQDRCHVAAVVFSGVDQTTPFEEAATARDGLWDNASNQLDESITATGLSTGQKVVVVALLNPFNSGQAIAPVSPQTWDNTVSPTDLDNGRTLRIGVLTSAGSSLTCNVRFSASGGTDGGYWSLRVFRVNDAGGGGAQNVLAWIRG